MVIDFSTARLYDGDFIREEDFQERIGDGDHVEEDGWMHFEVDGLEEEGLFVEFCQTISGYFTYCPGDYWTPPDCSFELTKEDFSIHRIMVNDVEVESTPEFERLVERLVDAEIQNRKSK